MKKQTKGRIVKYLVVCLFLLADFWGVTAMYLISTNLTGWERLLFIFLQQWFWYFYDEHSNRHFCSICSRNKQRI